MNFQNRDNFVHVFALHPSPLDSIFSAMKSVELSDDAYEALERLASAKQLSPAELISSLLGAGRPLTGDHLLFFLTGTEFAKQHDPIERYLALLAWVARNYACDFGDFVSQQHNARRYLMLSRDEVNQIRTHNHARQIDGTQFWAVMAIDTPTRARFVRRLLEFIGCHDETVAQAISAIGLDGTPVTFRLPRVA
jgi:negative modulator of initiation of replication